MIFDRQSVKYPALTNPNPNPNPNSKPKHYTIILTQIIVISAYIIYNVIR